MNLPRPLVWPAAAALALSIAASPVWAEAYRYSRGERIVLLRDLTAEYATAKLAFPRAKKPLPVDAETGEMDLAEWSDSHQKHGPAARMGDILQITKVTFEKNRLVFDLNGGFKGGRKWYERIQIMGGGNVGGSSGVTPVGGPGQDGRQAAGTRLALVFPDGVPELDAQQVKELLTPIMDFEKRTATEQYVESLPEPVQAAIKEKRAVEEMDIDAVLLAMGKPERKIRETTDGVEYEDWVYGTPPGRVVFVTFRGGKVVKVRESYGGLGGSTAAPLPAQ